MMMQKSERVSAQTHSTFSVDRPGSPADWTFLGATIAAAIPFVFANAVIVVHRHRIYFKAQGGVDLILGSSVSGLIWIASSFVEYEHFRRDTGILQVCTLWSFWVHLTFGFCLWLVCLSMRLHRLQILASEGAKQEKRSQLRAWTVYIPLFMAPSLAFCVLATIKHILIFQNIQTYGFSCQYAHTGWKLAGFLILPLFYISVLLFLMYKLRGKADYMLITEYRHTCEVVGMTMMTYVLNAILFWSDEQYRTSGRCFLTFCVCSLVFFDFWLHMGRPVFLCLFRPKFEMDNLEERSRARVLFALASMRTRGVPSINMPSCEGALLEAVSATIAEVESYKSKKDELEKEKVELVGRIDELRRQLGFSTISL